MVENCWCDSRPRTSNCSPACSKSISISCSRSITLWSTIFVPERSITTLFCSIRPSCSIWRLKGIQLVNTADPLGQNHDRVVVARLDVQERLEQRAQRHAIEQVNRELDGDADGDADQQIGRQHGR